VDGRIDRQLPDGTGNRPPVKGAKKQGEKIFRPKTCVGSPLPKNAQAATLTDNMGRLEHKTVQAARPRGYRRLVWEGNMRGLLNRRRAYMLTLGGK
jgi:hypothetical protein